MEALGTLITAGNRFELKEVNSIGRSPSCDIHLKSRSISAKHAIIEMKSHTAVLKDCNSRNGTFVNDVKVSNGNAVVLNTGATVRFGYDVASYLFEHSYDKYKKETLELECSETIKNHETTITEPQKKVVPTLVEAYSPNFSDDSLVSSDESIKLTSPLKTSVNVDNIPSLTQDIQPVLKQPVKHAPNVEHQPVFHQPLRTVQHNQHLNPVSMQPEVIQQPVQPEVIQQPVQPKVIQQPVQPKVIQQPVQHPSILPEVHYKATPPQQIAKEDNTKMLTDEYIRQLQNLSLLSESRDEVKESLAAAQIHIKDQKDQIERKNEEIENLKTDFDNLVSLFKKIECTVPTTHTREMKTEFLSDFVDNFVEKLKNERKIYKKHLDLDVDMLQRRLTEQKNKVIVRNWQELRHQLSISESRIIELELTLKELSNDYTERIRTKDEIIYNLQVELTDGLLTDVEKKQKAQSLFCLAFKTEKENEKLRNEIAQLKRLNRINQTRVDQLKENDETDETLKSALNHALNELEEYRISSQKEILAEITQRKLEINQINTINQKTIKNNNLFSIKSGL
ncbi:hypothetical protein PCE1_004574 [Barthelona sp. PCE]